MGTAASQHKHVFSRSHWNPRQPMAKWSRSQRSWLRHYQIFRESLRLQWFSGSVVQHQIALEFLKHQIGRSNRRQVLYRSHTALRLRAEFIV